MAYRKKGELRSSQEEHNAPVRILPRTLQYLKEGAKPFLHSGKGRSLSQWESVPVFLSAAKGLFFLSFFSDILGGRVKDSVPLIFLLAFPKGDDQIHSFCKSL